jgi:hypothetical protein
MRQQVQEPVARAVEESFAARHFKTSSPEGRILSGAVLSSIGTLAQVLGSFPSVDEPTVTLYLEWAIIILGFVFMIWGVIERIGGET